MKLLLTLAQRRFAREQRKLRQTQPPVSPAKAQEQFERVMRCSYPSEAGKRSPRGSSERRKALDEHFKMVETPLIDGKRMVPGFVLES